MSIYNTYNLSIFKNVKIKRVNYNNKNIEKCILQIKLKYFFFSLKIKLSKKKHQKKKKSVFNYIKL
jgi:hypothetical protein